MNHHRASADAIGRMLAADTLNIDALHALARRDRVGPALQILASFADAQSDLISVLLERQVSDRLRIFRLAVAFGAEAGQVDHVRPPVTVERLQNKAAEGDPKAARALAAYGSPTRDFSQLTKQERAAFCVGKLVALAFRGASP